MFNLDNLKIRTKLILLLFVPVVALLLFASVGWSQRNDTARRANTDKHIVEAAAATSDLIAALQHEAVASVGTVAGVESDTDPAELQKRTDEAVEQFVDVNAKLDLDGNTAAVNDVSTAFTTLETSIDSIKGFRGQLDSKTRKGQWYDAIDDYRTNSINGFVDYVQELAKLTTTPEVVLPLEQLAALLDYNLQTTSLGMMAVAASANGEDMWTEPPGSDAPDAEETGPDDPVTRSRAYDLAVDQDTRNAVLRRVAGSAGPINSYFNKNVKLDGPLASAFGNWQVAQPLAGGSLAASRDTFAFPAEPVPLADLQSYVTQLGEAASDLTDRTVDQIDTQRSDAVSNARLYVLLGVLAIFAAIAAAIVITVSITRRLAKLTDAADRLSHEQLPRLVDSLKNPAEDDVGYLTSSFAEIDVSGSDEIGQLAGAFNRIQGVAVDVATEQAQLLRKGIGDMFVNLARRNQSLLDRQIEFIDELENAEEDPDQLENLFRLDHLATRMRRNAESLLVLAGAEPSRRRGRPVPLADVVRAAVGEVEDFARIDMLQFDEVLVASNAALDIAHLLSELMENAANFSPPDTRVEVVGHRTKAEGYVISVTDHGIGMAPDAIAEANDLLARPPLVGLAMSRSLGFIVIGRLAARFGIAVRLMPSPSSGTTAMVSLPPALITEPAGGPDGPGELTETGAAPVPRATENAASLAEGTDRRPAARRRPEGPTPTRKPTERPTPVRRPAADLPTRGGGLPRRGADAPASVPQREPATAGTGAAPEGVPTGSAGPAATTTSSGLTKRVPRRAGGKRAVPGGDGTRAATQNRRSPDEVRSMLSSYRSGMKQGRADDASAARTDDTTPKEPEE